MLVGLYRPDSGSISIRGEVQHIRSPQDSMALGIGMVHQEFMLVGNMSVLENIILGLKDLPRRPRCSYNQKEDNRTQRYLRSSGRPGCDHPQPECRRTAEGRNTEARISRGRDTDP